MKPKENTGVIQITDLSIGDFVLDGTQIAQITGITCDGIIETTVNKNSNIELIEPIELTKEILKRGGFKEDFDYYSIDDGVGVYLISKDKRITISDIYLNSNNKWCVHVDTEDMCTLGSLELTYVHEFQHFLRICKIEENITL